MGTSKELYDLNRVYFESVYKQEPIDEKMNAGLRAYLDKKKGGKTEDKEENGNGKNGKASKGSKPDFLDLDKDGNKTEPMKKASKEKKMNEAIGEGDPQSDAVKQYVKYSSKTSKKKKSMKEGSSYGITKGSGTPSGPMAAFGKAPRMQKGAMAYDGPNKAASEAKDRIMAKTKAKKASMKEAMMVTNADKKANTPAYQGMKAGKKDKDGKPMYKAADHMKEATHSKDIQGYADAYKDVQEMSYGYQGGGMVKKATKKKGKKPTITVTTPDRLASMKIMTPKESYDALIESGIFSEEEIAKFIWVEFDDFEESVEHRRNPEKYAEKPDDELSFEQRRKKRMNDPKRGINSPAFKEFMRRQGM